MGLHDGIRLTDLAGLGAVEEAIVTPTPVWVHEGLTKVLVGKRHAIILIEKADIDRKRLEDLVEPTTLGICGFDGVTEIRFWCKVLR